MQAYHYLGSLAKIGETLWHAATYLGQWAALLSFSSAALKCGVRDCWIGWNFRYQYSRLNLLTNNSRFLILPDWHYPNLASKTLSLCLKRLSAGWLAHNERQKQTNEIGKVIPLLDAIAIQGKTITVDALLTQRKSAEYVVNREAVITSPSKITRPRYVNIALFFENRQEPDYIDYTPPDYGRIETRKIWTTTGLNHYLDFPHVGQAFVIEGKASTKKRLNVATKSFTG